MTDTNQPETTLIPTEHLRILFDALAQSMDFGSGFLDTEEVEALRAIATLLGVDPSKATPSEFVSQYPHPYTTRDSLGRDRPGFGCHAGGRGRCQAAPDDPIHAVTEEPR